MFRRLEPDELASICAIALDAVRRVRESPETEGKTVQKPEKNERQDAVNRAADVICNVVDETLLPVMTADVVGFALMMNTARIIGDKILSTNPESVTDAGEMKTAITGDLQNVCLRYLRRHGVGIENDPYADISDGNGGVDKFKLRSEVDNAIEELEEAVGALCAYYGSQIVAGGIFAILGNLASDALVMYRETQGGRAKIEEAETLSKAVVTACHKAYCETLQAHGVPIISVDVTSVPPQNPEHN